MKPDEDTVSTLRNSGLDKPTSLPENSMYKEFPTENEITDLEDKVGLKSIDTHRQLNENESSQEISDQSAYTRISNSQLDD